MRRRSLSPWPCSSVAVAVLLALVQLMARSSLRDERNLLPHRTYTKKFPLKLTLYSAPAADSAANGIGALLNSNSIITWSGRLQTRKSRETSSRVLVMVAFCALLLF